MAKVDYGTIPAIPARDADGRLRATRVGKVIDFNLRTKSALDDAGVFLPIGTPLPGYPTVILADVECQFPEKGDSSPRLIESYIEANGTFTQVGPDIQDREMNGLLRVRRKLIALAGTSLPAMTVGTTAGPSGTVLAQHSTEGSNQAVTLLTQVFMEPGIVAESESISNNGKLTQRTIEGFGMTPGTPTGFVLVETTESNVEGYPTVRVQYAKGDGEISRDTNTSNNGALSTITIRHLTAPGAANPIVTPAGYVLVSSAVQEADGHRVWSAQYAKGTGEVSRDTNTSNNGALETITIRHLTAPGAANPIATPAGYVLVSEAKQEADGHRVWSAQYAKGSGVVSTTTQKGEGGVETVQTETLYAPMTVPTAPASFISRTVTERDGHVLVSLTTLAVSGGTNGTQISYSESRRSDGSIAYDETVVYDSSVGTYTPPSGSYLVSKVTRKLDGGKTQVAYGSVKPPPDTTTYQTVGFPIPGLAETSAAYSIYFVNIILMIFLF